MDKVRIGLVGCGLFGESHLQAYRAVRTAQIDAVYDRDRDRAERLAREFKVPRVCNSLAELCGIAELQAIDVVTPEHSHVEPVLAGLAAGKHVFVEKPLAVDLDECSQMIDAAQKSGRFLLVGHILRYETKFAMLKDEIRSGRLGRVVSIHAKRNRLKQLIPLYGRIHPALETGIHDIDLILWYVDRPVRKVRGFGRKATTEKYPDIFWGVIEFDDGTIAILETIWLLPQVAGVMLDDAFQIFGTEGVANLRLVPGALELWRDGGAEVPDVSYDPRVGGAARGALRDELAYFCDCVLDGRTPQTITPQQARRAVQVALALIESANSEKDVTISNWQ